MKSSLTLTNTQTTLQSNAKKYVSINPYAKPYCNFGTGHADSRNRFFPELTDNNLGVDSPGPKYSNFKSVQMLQKPAVGVSFTRSERNFSLVPRDIELRESASGSLLYPSKLPLQSTFSPIRALKKCSGSQRSFLTVRNNDKCQTYRNQ